MTGKPEKFVAMARSKKIVVAALLAVGFVGMSAVSATAASFTHTTTGLRFEGQYVFEPRSVSQGAFHWSGTLNDTQNDGNAGKIQVAVEGYGYNTFYNPVDKDESWDRYVYDPQVLETNKARVQICRDRGTLVPDNCSREQTYRRR